MYGLPGVGRSIKLKRMYCIFLSLELKKCFTRSKENTEAVDKLCLLYCSYKE